MRTPDAGASALSGGLSLQFASPAGRTRLIAATRTAPLQLQRLLPVDRCHPALVRAMLLNATAGLFAGDTLHVDITLTETAGVSIGTPAMTRVFGMPDGKAEVETSLRVSSGSYLEYLPEPTLMCATASLRQRTQLFAEPGARAAVGEVTAFGRVAHGELHAYRRLEQCIEVWCGAQPILIERLLLAPQQHANGLRALARYAAHGNLQLICPPSEAPVLLQQVRAAITPSADLSVGASLLHENAGVAVRALGCTPTAVQAMFRKITLLFRRAHCP